MCKLKTILDLILSKAISSGPINGFQTCGFFGAVKAVNLSQLFAIPQFDAETELLFWQARNPVLLAPMKSALLLGALGFLAFIILDVYSGNVSLLEAWLRLPIVIVLCALFGYLHFGSKSLQQLNTIAKISAVLSSADLLAVFLIDGQPQYYAETWPGLLPIYFFSYGQMLMPLRATVYLGWVTALAMPLSGYFIGVEILALVPSLIILWIINLFGLCTRYQLEAYSRQSFLEMRKAEESAAAKSEFLRQFCHNLGQPLQAMGCYSSILDSALSNHNHPELVNIAQKLGSTVDEFNNAFSRLLDIAGLESGQQTPLINSVDINLILAGMEAQFAAQARKRGLKLIVHLRLKPPYNVRSDAIMLRQMLSNLIDNAIKYTSQGWVMIAATKIADDQLKLSIWDSGCGIPEELHQKIFQEFIRGTRREGDKQMPGLGIGLAYVASVLKRLPTHQLKLYSIPQRGSHFQLYLPVSDSQFRTNSTYPAVDLHGQYVLLVDDDPQVLNAMADQLLAWGCLVQTASSLKETLKVLADNIRPPDLLISDFYLDYPETAHDIVAAVQADCGSIPTLIISARAISDHDKAQFPVQTRLLRKPASAKMLMTTLAEMLGI